MSDDANRWSKWWIINGGQIHQAWKYRQWSLLRDIAQTKPKQAWDEQQKIIASQSEEIVKLNREVAKLRRVVEKLREFAKINNCRCIDEIDRECWACREIEAIARGGEK